MPIKILSVVGARPNFVKIAPILDAMKEYPSIESKLVHTGQHYDYTMNQSFFEDLSIPNADISLGIGSGSHAAQTAGIMVAFEEYCIREKPDFVLVVGDVNSTIACALAAKKLNISVAHVEAGLRSGDMRMPEEINRRCTDAITDIFFVSEPSGLENLRNEGVPEQKVHYSGNVMIDTLFKHKARASALSVPERFGLRQRDYGLVTLHRPSNTDNRENLRKHLKALRDISLRLPIIFPMHPRTRDAVVKHGFETFLDNANGANIKFIEPLRYLEFVGLLQAARLVITDSGGLQEETTALGVPCLTMRDNTERPITVTHGTNRLIGSDAANLPTVIDSILNSPWPQTPAIKHWDGYAAKRIVERLSL